MNTKRLERLATSTWVILLLAVLVIALLVVLVVRYHHTSTKIDLTTAPGTTQSSKNNATTEQTAQGTPKNACTAGQLASSLTIEGAAGNIYGTYAITNTGTKSCQIIGNKYLQVSYSLTIKNLAVSNQGDPGPLQLTLDPGTPIYATVHYPNGPQCSTATKPVTVSFSYPISTQANLELGGENGTKQVTVEACELNADITTIQVSSLSTTKPY